MSDDDMKVIEYATFYNIKNPKSKGLKKFIDKLSTVNYQTKENIRYGYFFDDDKKELRIPRGVGREEIIDTFDIEEDIIESGGYIKNHDDIKFDMVHDPYPRQRKTINKVIDSFKNDSETQAIIDMPTGTGKSYSGVYVNHKVEKSALIFTFETQLAKQWKDNYIEHTDIDPDTVYIIQGSNDIASMIEEGHKYNVFITTHASVRSFLNRFDMKMFNKFLVNASISLKIYDEFDRESFNMFNIDLHTSVPYNLYLSATPYRSSKWDDNAFQYAFNDTFQIGIDFFKDVTPNRKAKFIFYYSTPSKKEEKKCYNWRFNHRWLKNNSLDKFKKQFDNHMYGIYLLGMDEDDYNPKKSFINAIEEPINEIKESMGEDSERKHIICTGRIDNCPKMKKLLVSKFGFKESDIGIYNSDIDDKEKEEALKRPVILSLSNSIGRGFDLDKLYLILDFEAYGSKSIFTQLIGRLARHGGIEGRYYKIIDLSFKNTYFYYKSIKKELDGSFKDVDYEKIEDKIKDRLKD